MYSKLRTLCCTVMKRTYSSNKYVKVDTIQPHIGIITLQRHPVNSLNKKYAFIYQKRRKRIRK